MLTHLQVKVMKNPEDSFEDSSEVSSDDERKTSSYNKASYNEIKVNI